MKFIATNVWEYPNYRFRFTFSFDRTMPRFNLKINTRAKLVYFVCAQHICRAIFVAFDLICIKWYPLLSGPLEHANANTSNVYSVFSGYRSSFRALLIVLLILMDFYTLRLSMAKFSFQHSFPFFLSLFLLYTILQSLLDYQKCSIKPICWVLTLMMYSNPNPTSVIQKQSYVGYPRQFNCLTHNKCSKTLIFLENIWCDWKWWSFCVILH